MHLNISVELDVDLYTFCNRPSKDELTKKM